MENSTCVQYLVLERYNDMFKSFLVGLFLLTILNVLPCPSYSAQIYLKYNTMWSLWSYVTTFLFPILLIECQLLWRWWWSFTSTPSFLQSPADLPVLLAVNGNKSHLQAQLHPKSVLGMAGSISKLSPSREARRERVVSVTVFASWTLQHPNTASSITPNRQMRTLKLRLKIVGPAAQCHWLKKSKKQTEKAKPRRQFPAS